MTLHPPPAGTPDVQPAGAPPAGLVVTGLGRVTSNGRVLLDGIHLHVPPGESLAVTGPSGAGKSTLLAVLAGLHPPDSGHVHLDGRPVTEEAHRRRTGLVLQGYGLVSALTAAENLHIVLRARGVTPHHAADQARTALDRVHLTGEADHLIDDLSGGQQQRVAVARALLDNPALLLADEPTAALDPTNRALLIHLLTEETHRGAVIVIATHDPELAATCTHQLHLRDGHPQPPPTQ